MDSVHAVDTRTRRRKIKKRRCNVDIGMYGIVFSTSAANLNIMLSIKIDNSVMMSIDRTRIVLVFMTGLQGAFPILYI